MAGSKVSDGSVGSETYSVTVNGVLTTARMSGPREPLDSDWTGCFNLPESFHIRHIKAPGREPSHKQRAVQAAIPSTPSPSALIPLPSLDRPHRCCHHRHHYVFDSATVLFAPRFVLHTYGQGMADSIRHTAILTVDFCQVARRQHVQPYDLSKRRKNVSTPALVPPVPSSRTLPTIRDAYLETILSEYPNFVPRHDFDILALGSGDYDGPECGVYRWLDRQLAEQVEGLGSARSVIASAKRILGGRDHITGVSVTSRVPPPLLTCMRRGNHVLALPVFLSVLSLVASTRFVSIRAPSPSESSAWISYTRQPASR